MTNDTENLHGQKASRLTVPELEELLGEDILNEIKLALGEGNTENDAADYAASELVHVSDEGCATTYDTGTPASDLDMNALAGMAGSVPGLRGRPTAPKLSRKERRSQKKEVKKGRSHARGNVKEQKKSYKSIQKQLKDRDKELSDQTQYQRYKRKTAKDVLSFIGYNRMYEDGICEAHPQKKDTRTRASFPFAVLAGSGEGFN